MMAARLSESKYLVYKYVRVRFIFMKGSFP